MAGTTINYKGRQYMIMDTRTYHGEVQYCLSNLETLRTFWVYEDDLAIIETYDEDKEFYAEEDVQAVDEELEL